MDVNLCAAGCTFKRSQKQVQSKALSDLGDLWLFWPPVQTWEGRAGKKKLKEKELQDQVVEHQVVPRGEKLLIKVLVLSVGVIVSPFFPQPMWPS